MSRIGKKLITIPAGVEVKLDGQNVQVKGPKGSLNLNLHPHVMAAMAEADGAKQLTFTVKDENLKDDRALWGLSRSLVQNMIVGVTQGYEEKLEIVGVGFKANVAGKMLTMEVGFSHEVKFPLPDGVVVVVDKNTITITGIDKQLVGETAARIRRVKKPEPYKGTGIKYVDEMVRRKAGKAATKAA